MCGWPSGNNSFSNEWAIKTDNWAMTNHLDLFGGFLKNFFTRWTKSNWWSIWLDGQTTHVFFFFNFEANFHCFGN